VVEVKHFKTLILLFFALLFFTTLNLSTFFHESIHVLQVESQGFEPKEVCYWGWTQYIPGAVGWVEFPKNFTLTKNNTYTRILFHDFKNVEFLPTLSEYVFTIIFVAIFSIGFWCSFKKEERGENDETPLMTSTKTHSGSPPPSISGREIRPGLCWLCGKEKGEYRINFLVNGKIVSSIWLCKRCRDAIEGRS